MTANNANRVSAEDGAFNGGMVNGAPTLSFRLPHGEGDELFTVEVIMRSDPKASIATVGLHEIDRIRTNLSSAAVTAVNGILEILERRGE